MKPLAYIASCLLMISSSALVAAEFQNLDFEEADPAMLEIDQGDWGTSGPADTRLPRWTFWLGNVQQTVIGLNRATVDGLSTSLHDKRAFGPAFNLYPPPPFKGSFGFIFKSQIKTPDHSPSLRQTGTIPKTAKMIRVRVFGDQIKISLNGQAIDLSYQLIIGASAGRPYLPITYAFGDISTFAGKTVTLKIEPDTENAVRTFAGIDNVEFTDEIIVSSNVILIDEGDPIVLRRLK